MPPTGTSNEPSSSTSKSFTPGAKLICMYLRPYGSDTGGRSQWWRYQNDKAEEVQEAEVMLYAPPNRGNEEGNANNRDGREGKATMLVYVRRDRSKEVLLYD
jgi:hypothetical protein